MSSKYRQKTDWAHRRKQSIPTDKKLFILACMDERLPVFEALNIDLGDAHIFRNAGGVVTDDAIRSVMLSIHFSHTEEIIIVNHTDCGMMTSTPEIIIESLRKKNIDITKITLDPALPELTVPAEKRAEWLKLFDDVDATCLSQIEYLKNHPLIPDYVTIHGYIWDVETMSLRRPVHTTEHSVE